MKLKLKYFTIFFNISTYKCNIATTHNTRKNTKNKKTLQKELTYNMASSKGFEPSTYCLGGNCSIQLSYEDKINVI